MQLGLLTVWWNACARYMGSTTLHQRARLLVRVTTVAPTRGHSVLNLRNIYITRHIPVANRTARSEADSRTSAEPASSCHFGFDQAGRRGGRRRATTAVEGARSLRSRFRVSSGLLCEKRDVTAVGTIGGKIKKCESVGRSGRPAARGTCRSIGGRLREARRLWRHAALAPSPCRRHLLNGPPRRSPSSPPPPPLVDAFIIQLSLTYTTHPPNELLGKNESVHTM